MVVCILVAVRVVLVVPRSPSFRCAQHFSHSAGCFCLRCCSKFVVLLPLLATDFEQTLQRGVVWSKFDLANRFQITDDTAFLRKISLPVAAMFVYHLGKCALCAGGGLSQFRTTGAEREGLADVEEKTDFHLNKST